MLKTLFEGSWVEITRVNRNRNFVKKRITLSEKGNKTRHDVYFHDVSGSRFLHFSINQVNKKLDWKCKSKKKNTKEILFQKPFNLKKKKK